MKAVGIICEYNPIHLGHRKQIDTVRAFYGPDTAIACLMSGSFVQRGAPAVFSKSLRAKAALACGADLVLELPVTCVLSSAEGFAAGGVRILSGFCDTLCFGSESADRKSLEETAGALLSPDFSAALRRHLDTGKSFPAARQDALQDMGIGNAPTENPNDILAVEYCKAILQQHSDMDIFPIRREGSYHARFPDPENPSATALRQQIVSGGSWLPYVPDCCTDILKEAPVHTLAAGEKAMLGKLRTMTDLEFEALPYGSEGLWRKFMHACRSKATLEEILTAAKSKRYTRSRLDRMAMCAFLGITAQMLSAPVPYTRVLGFSEKGKTLLKSARQTGNFLHTGEAAESPFWALEQRCSDLYGLFAVNGPEPAGKEKQQRVIIF